jgi:hypothetical protein
VLVLMEDMTVESMLASDGDGLLRMIDRRAGFDAASEEARRLEFWWVHKH